MASMRRRLDKLGDRDEDDYCEQTGSMCAVVMCTRWPKLREVVARLEAEGTWTGGPLPPLPPPEKVVRCEGCPPEGRIVPLDASIFHRRSRHLDE